jgi:peptidoglycan/LPS O-acetylase OafA/YrhL
LRIFPLYYFAIGVAWIVVTLAGNHPSQLDGKWPWLLGYGTNIAAARGGWFPLSHFWSLAIEEHFYLVWPWFVWNLGKKGLSRACWAMVAVSLGLRFWFVARSDAMSAYVLTPCRLDGLAMGSWLAIVLRAEQGTARVGRISHQFLCFGGIGAVSLFAIRRGASWTDPAIQTLGYTLCAILASGLVARAAIITRTAWIDRVLSARVLRWLGKYSYGVYVWHSSLICLAEGLGLDSVGVRLALVGAAIAAAWASYHVIERPFLHYGHPPRAELRIEGSRSAGGSAISLRQC